MLLHIIESATGDTLGNVNISGMEEEDILAWLCAKGFLEGDESLYEITRTYPFAEGELLVLDLDSHSPVLKLELPEVKEAA
jgi:hypothetical protein